MREERPGGGKQRAPEIRRPGAQAETRRNGEAAPDQAVKRHAQHRGGVDKQKSDEPGDVQEHDPGGELPPRDNPRRLLRAEQQHHLADGHAHRREEPSGGMRQELARGKQHIRHGENPGRDRPALEDVGLPALQPVIRRQRREDDPDHDVREVGDGFLIHAAGKGKLVARRTWREAKAALNGYNSS